MSTWYRKVQEDLGELVNCISAYEAILDEARVECGMKGNLEKLSREMPGIVEHRFNQLQEIEAILEFLNIELRKKRSYVFRKYTEHYNKALSSRDAEKYVDGDIDGVNLIPYLTGKKDGLPHEFLYWQNRDKDIDVIRGERYKYLRIGSEEFIFDLKNDISEENNILNSSESIYEGLKSKFNEWDKEMIDPVFLDLGSGKEYDKLHPNRWYDSNQEKQ